MSCLLKVLQGTVGIKGEMELVAPSEFESCVGQGIVSDGCTGMSLCQVRSVGRYLVGHYANPYVLLVR